MKLLRALQVFCAIFFYGFCLSVFASDFGRRSGARCLAETPIQLSILRLHDDLFVRRSCDQARVLLIAAGARADAKSTSDGCVRGFGRPDKFARARLTFFTLAPVGKGEGASPPSMAGGARSRSMIVRRVRSHSATANL